LTVFSILPFDFALAQPGFNELIGNHKKSGIRKIIKEDNFSDYVYDIGTEDGTFVGGVGNILFKNSDELYGDDLMKTLEKFWDAHKKGLWFELKYCWGKRKHGKTRQTF